MPGRTNVPVPSPRDTVDSIVRPLLRLLVMALFRMLVSEASRLTSSPVRIMSNMPISWAMHRANNRLRMRATIRSPDRLNR